MNAVLILLLLVASGGVLLLTPGLGPGALAVAAVGAGIALFFVSRCEFDQQFLMRVFLAAFLIRIVVATMVFQFGWQDFFGGDAVTYDFNGYFIQQGWHGNRFYASLAQTFTGAGASAWGMIYLVGAIYEVIGRNPLAIQFVNAVLGAATPVIIFLCAQHIFGNNRVSRAAALLTAFFPSLVLWSSQGLKDGPIVFSLALSILATLKLGERLSLKYGLILTGCLISLLSLRFYIFYMMVAAVGGALIIGMRKVTAQSFLRQFVVLVGIGLVLTWFGVVRYANVQFASFANLEAVQRSRYDLARNAESGFGRDVDVSTTEGALSAIPVGMTYLLFAPFPWQITNLRQSITLPEMIVWWAAFPLLILGVVFAIKYRLRQIFPILIFSVMLSLAYSVFQGNVGTAYRQRAQLLIFYFIFVAVGLVLVKEKREERARKNLEQTLEEWRQREATKEKRQLPLIDDRGQRIEA